MFKEVKDKLVEVLETLLGDGQPLTEVFGYMEPSPQQFPCAMVRVSGTSSESRLDTFSNEMNMEFTIRVLMDVDNTEDAEDQRLELLDAIMDAFRTQANVDTLGGLVEKFAITTMIQIETSENQPLFGFDLICQASKIMTIL